MQITPQKTPRKLQKHRSCVQEGHRKNIKKRGENEKVQNPSKNEQL